MIKRQASKFLRTPSMEEEGGADEATRLLESAQTTPTVVSVESGAVGAASTTTHVSFVHAVRNILFGSYVNLFLVFAPFAVWSYLAEWGDIPVFVFNFLTMLPLASMLGDATEALAFHAGDTIGGLVNATFGNAVEVIIAIFALKKGEVALVQSSLIGSMLSNMLLVLGSCFIAGHVGGASESVFNAQSASVNMSLLFLSSFAMLVPSYYQYSKPSIDLPLLNNDDAVLGLSHISALFLILMYILLMVYQLVTHRAILAEKDEDEEEPELSFQGSLVVLLVMTLLVSLFSEFLVSSVDGFTVSADIPKPFVGIILLPIVGNAVEHITAIKVALKNNMELAMGVAVGSATQIAVFVVPVCVIAGWLMGQPMTLAFNAFEAMTYVVSSVIVYVVVADGKSNWLEGAMLIVLYCLVGVALLEISI
ncbi:calcium/proton exchanger [Aphanomyces invadans]|uniref:Calcium/proton exchanger n=1 Tax=Aphanomyces invadans TaxID=157072 RepID=A0A024UCV8_9STRA|nr:calcium/proton exchanger [Aphanomyces invadans]ETW04256.1 calcium/proton exchanger [Aphanomyces invadans]|eukprot:XP_008867212.1 calcium/proton exchanger [Aphanomyces invadans]